MNTLTLDDGRQVTWSLKRRDRDPFYLVVFRGPGGTYLERSTKQATKGKAESAALGCIRNAYAPTIAGAISWDDAIALMKEHMTAGGIRPSSIKSYKDKVETLRDIFPRTFGPGDITPASAEQYKSMRLKDKKSPYTVRGDINKLSIVYRKWLIKAAKVLTENPFAGVEPPKVDRLDPRRITPEEQAAFFGWFSQKWDGWRLPLLFLEVKASIGCRITELAALPRAALEDGRVTFHAVTAKGRRTRRCKLPASLYNELKALPGEKNVWESFTDGLRSIHKGRGRHDHAANVRDFTPQRFVSWLEDQQQAYFAAHPSIRRFKLHNFRGLAMTRAKEMGVSYDDAATAFGCHPETMRRHYLALDEVTIADEVFDRLQR